MTTGVKEGKIQGRTKGASISGEQKVVKISPKDAPAVDRALCRSKLYLLISWGYLYPEDEEFLDYLQSGEFVEDGRAALEGLKKVLQNLGGQEGADRIQALSSHFDAIEKWVSSEGENWNIQDLRDEHRRVFSNVIALDCPPYETLFGNDHVFGQSYVMGDIAGFYSAFGLQLSPDIHERLDHLSVELEFMHYLAYKESYAILHDGAEKLRTVLEAEKKFVKEHIGRWVPLFAGMLKRKADYGLYKVLADFTSDWLAFDIAFLGVTPQAYSETDYRPATAMNPEGQSFECGAQDKGNELSLLMSEVGADAFLDKESGASEESGNA
ncbi:MAG: molecular chaperone TorD family protein [Nitrospirales bacterium]